MYVVHTVPAVGTCPLILKKKDNAFAFSRDEKLTYNVFNLIFSISLKHLKMAIVNFLTIYCIKRS